MIYLNNAQLFGSLRSSAARFGFVLLLVGTAWGQGEYEEPATLRASEILPETLYKGEYFQVEDEVASDGLWNVYILRTQFSDYKLHGTFLLADRIHEIRALAELKKLDEGLLIAQGALDSVKRTEENLVQTATHPVQTVEALGQGLKRIFAKVGGGLNQLNASSASSDPGTASRTFEQVWKMGKDVSGISRTERSLARRVGVDPYSTNAELRKEIQRLAIFEAAGDIATSSLIPIPRPIGLAVSVSGIAWNEDPEVLRELNMKRMEEMGVSEAVMQQFLANSFYTLSGETQLIEGLHSLGEIPGQEEFLLRASHADTPQLATFFLISAALLGRHHQEQSVLEILPETVSAVARVPGDRLVLLFPADHVAWTEELGPEITALNERVRNRHPDHGIELRLTGSVTQRFREKVSSLGWNLVENTASYDLLVNSGPSNSINESIQ